ncbi:hypothetical protein GCM10027563_30480 [Parasphingorhabdus pacifica]
MISPCDSPNFHPKRANPASLDRRGRRDAEGWCCIIRTGIISRRKRCQRSGGSTQWNGHGYCSTPHPIKQDENIPRGYARL